MKRNQELGLGTWHWPRTVIFLEKKIDDLFILDFVPTDEVIAYMNVASSGVPNEFRYYFNFNENVNEYNGLLSGNILGAATLEPFLNDYIVIRQLYFRMFFLGPMWVQIHILL